MFKASLAPSGFQGRLLLILLAITTLPLVLVALAFFFILNANIEDETFSKLSFVRDAKRSELAQYLTFASRQAASLAQSNPVRYSIGDFYGFSYAFRQIDDDPDVASERLQAIFGVSDTAPEPAPDALLRTALEYSNAHGRFHEEYLGFIQSSEFDNLYLVNMDGHVVYSAEKDEYLGGDVLGAKADSRIGALFATALSQDDPIAVSDFAFDPVTGAFGAYVGVRVEFYQHVRGMVAFRLPATGLDAIVQAQEGETGNFFLLGAETQLISAPATYPTGIGSVLDLPRDLEPGTGSAVVEQALSGGPALVARGPIAFGDLDWTLVAEVPNREAFARSEALTQFVFWVAALVLPALALVAFLLSRTMTAPLHKLTAVAEAIAAGDLDRSMPSVERPSETGRLAESFKRMRDALRDQLSLVGQKNAELERHLRLIEEKNAALEEADRLKDTFVANTSHELRTPLNGIIGISETLSAGAVGEVTPTQRSQLELITFSARRLSRLVDDLLDLYRIRQGRMRLDIHPVHVASSIRNVLHLSEPMLRGEPVNLDVDIPETLPYVMADPVRFEQVLYNLLGNAIKYTDHGAIRIDAYRDGDRISVAVTDTGIGIAPDNLERIFQPLERGETPEVMSKHGGAGLGLTIARQLAAAMNGEIKATSALGEGSRFVIELPVAEGAITAGELLASGDRIDGARQALDALPASLVPTEETPAGDAPLILVVDDEPINIQVLRNVLAPQGYRVHAAGNGLEAIACVEARKPDLVILDVMMPQMGGLEAARRLRDRYGFLELPIIMVTARSRTRDVVAGFEHGANDYVSKPFVKDELLARIANLLAAGRAHGAARENAELRSEIDRRVQVEDALRLSQQRMTRLLDTLDAGLVCVGGSGTIIYANRAASVHAGRVIKPGTTQLTDIVGPDLSGDLASAVAADGRARRDAVSLGHPGQPALLNAFELDAEAGGGFAIVMTRDTSETRQASEHLVRSVRGVIDSVGTALTHPAAIVPELADDPEDSGAADDRQTYRATIVAVMNQSLALWRRAHKGSKIDFAEQSGVWRVNLDRSSLQARTFDKYLLIETLPDNPRWRDVVQTAEFALGAVDPGHTEDPELRRAHDELDRSLARLRTHLRESVLVKSRTEADPTPTARS